MPDHKHEQEKQSAQRELQDELEQLDADTFEIANLADLEQNATDICSTSSSTSSTTSTCSSTSTSSTCSCSCSS